MLARLLPEIADALQPLGHRPQRELLRADVSALNLIPADRRRDGCAWAGADGVGRGGITRDAVLRVVDRDDRPFVRLAAGAADPIGRGGGQRLGDASRPGTNVRERVARLDRHEDVHAGRAAQLDKRGEAAPVPICLHLDHSTSVEYCKQCADSGYTNIMIDASKQAWEENIRQTKEVVDYCHSVGNISVEGELGTVGGVEDQIKIAEDEAALANPIQVVEFVEMTGGDIFAPAIGTAHGVYKTKNPKVDFERLGKINQLLNGDGIKTPLVVHGGTGLSEEYVCRLLEMGGAKFNVSTELKYTLIDTTYNYITENRQQYDPGKVDVAVKDATRLVVGRWIDLLGSAGKA